MLFKNTFQLFKKKKFQFLGVCIIIFLSSFLFTAMFNTMETMQNTINKYLTEGNQEDFSIDMINSLTAKEYEELIKENLQINPLTTLTNLKAIDKGSFDKILDNRIKSFNDRYEGYDLEAREGKDVTFNLNNTAVKLRFLKGSENINKSKIEEGKKPESKNEIALTRVFAEMNNLTIEDTIEINNKRYEIVGYVLFPDYTLPMFGTDFILDAKTISLALVSNDEFYNLEGKEEIRLSGKGNENFNTENFKKDVIETYRDDSSLGFITNINLTKETMRSGAIYEEVKAGKVATVSMSSGIAFIAIIIVSIILYKIINGEKGQIGIMKALGYRKREIAKPYLIMITIISLPTLLLGALLGFFISEPLKEFYSVFYLFPHEEMIFAYESLIYSILVPFICIFSLSFLIIMRMLKTRPLDLLRVGKSEGINKLNKIADKILSRAKATTKFKYSFLLRDYGKFIVFLIGVISSSVMIMFSLTMPDFMGKMTMDNYKIQEYKYDGIVDITKELPKIDNEDEKYLTLPSIKYKDKSVEVKGIDINGKLFRLYNKKDKDVTEEIQDGIIVTKSFQMFNKKKIGDEITININNKDYTFEIKEIADDYSSSTIYIDREKLSNIISDNKDSSLFNGVYSKDSLDKKDYLTVTNKQDIIDQAASMQKFVIVAIGGMLISAIFMAAIILSILTSLSVEDNYYNISLLKVMGYSKKEVNSMILNSYLGYSIIAFLISIPITIASMNFFVDYLATGFNMVMPLEFKAWHGVVGLLIVILIFLIGSYGAKRKINKIALQEILKEYRE